MRRFLCLTLLASLAIGQAEAKIVHRSENMKPRWLKSTPKPTNDTYEMVVTEVALAETLDGARLASLKELAEKTAHSSTIESTEDFGMISEQFGKNGDIDTEDYKDCYMLTVKAQNDKVRIVYRKITEYYEVHVDGGVKTTKLWTLYAVGKNRLPLYDKYRETCYYGAAPAVMSVVPGLGQVYKGSTVKGIAMFAGVAACAGAALFCDNERSDYRKKIAGVSSDATAKSYRNKADNYETARNLFLGAAAAIWVWNIVDAAAAKGAKRVIVSKSRGSSLAFHPTFTPDGTALTLTYNF